MAGCIVNKKSYLHSNVLYVGKVAAGRAKHFASLHFLALPRPATSNTPALWAMAFRYERRKVRWIIESDFLRKKNREGYKKCEASWTIGSRWTGISPWIVGMKNKRREKEFVPWTVRILLTDSFRGQDADLPRAHNNMHVP